MPLGETTPNYAYKPNVFRTLLCRVNIPFGIVNKNILNFSRGHAAFGWCAVNFADCPSLV
jgi:hypothetical protein